MRRGLQDDDDFVATIVVLSFAVQFFRQILDSSRSAISTHMLMLQQFEPTDMYSNVSYYRNF